MKTPESEARAAADGTDAGPADVAQRRELTPNQIDCTDESLKAADIARAGEELAPTKSSDPDCPGETPQSIAPCAPDGRNAERYSG